MISLNELGVTFNPGTVLENRALQAINLQIKPGDFICLIGGNGAGKSTLMNVLAGEIIASQGEILFDGQNITSQPVYWRANLISRVFQDPRLSTYEHLTLEENLAFAAQRGTRRSLKLALTAKLRQQFKILLSELEIGLEHRLQDQVGMLSGGQRQALSLLMATLRPSRLLLLDEHTAALDQKMAQIILALTQRIITQHQLTAIMITHNLTQALEFGNRLLLMQQGKIIKDLNHFEREQLTAAELVALL